MEDLRRWHCIGTAVIRKTLTWLMRCTVSYTCWCDVYLKSFRVHQVEKDERRRFSKSIFEFWLLCVHGSKKRLDGRGTLFKCCKTIFHQSPSHNATHSFAGCSALCCCHFSSQNTHSSADVPVIASFHYHLKAFCWHTFTFHFTFVFFAGSDTRRASFPQKLSSFFCFFFKFFLSCQNQLNIPLCSLICTGCLWFLTHSHSFLPQCCEKDFFLT